MLFRNEDGSLTFLNTDSFHTEKTKYNELWKRKYNKVIHEKKEISSKDNMINYLDGKKISL